MKMLEISRVDLPSLAEALEDHSDFGSWWLDPASGAVEERPTDLSHEDAAGNSPVDRGFRRIEPLPSGESYADLQDFTERVRDRRARELLKRAIAGRGAFRRFKDTLVEYPQLRQAWFAFHDARMKRRAIEWLADTGLVDGDAAERALAEVPEPELSELGGAFDAEETARAVAADLRAIYGPRLRRVVLFGSYARGDADDGSDLDLAVVLDRVNDPWAEIARMDDILWRHTLSTGVIVSAIPVAERDFEAPLAPAIARARAEGHAVA
ncbi:MAG TPA: UPF0158 family protein [Verrucomicrobiae bacterium]|nr:UPF0158 family protein [Verrucomicrobiae bacterium]